MSRSILNGKGRAYIIVGSLFIIFLIPAILLADDQTFGVTSFIPTRFTDTEWRIDGKLGYSHNTTKSDYFIAPYENHALINSENSGGIGTLNLTSNLKYRYETVPIAMCLKLGLAGQIDNQSSDAYEKNSFIYSDAIGSINYKMNTYQLYANPSIDIALYFKDDFFVSLLSNSGISYWRRHSHSVDISESWTPKLYDTDSVVYVKSKDGFKADADRNIYSFQFVLMPGWGRLYEGRFASTSIDIINELRKSKLLSTEPSYTQMMQLTELIYQYRMHHVIDSRIHLIKSLQGILNYLRDEKIIDNCDIMTFLLTQDVWNYFPNEARSFGFKMRVGLGVDYIYFNRQERRLDQESHLRIINRQDSLNPTDTILNSNYSNRTYSHIKERSFSDYCKFEVIYARPLNHRLQLDLNFESLYYFKKWEEYCPTTRCKSEIEYARYITLTNIGQLRFFKDSKTSFIFSLQTAYSQLREKCKDNNQNTCKKSPINSWNLSAMFGTTYRISIPTTISANISYKNKNNRLETLSEKDDRFYLIEININVNHYIL
jgi:hypothetical protein